MVTATPTDKDNRSPSVAAESAFFCLFWPKYPAIKTLTPTPIQIDNAFISVVIGNESETAASDCSLIFATNILSTRLYEYCKNIEISGGADICNISLFIGLYAILFSAFIFAHSHNYIYCNYNVNTVVFQPIFCIF